MSSDLGRRGVSGSPAPEGADAAGATAAVPSPDSATGQAGAAGTPLVFDDPLDRPSADDSDRGWGESFAHSADDDFTRFLNEKPPHHL